MFNTQQSALTLLLRSPRLSISRILDLLDVSDRDFRLLLQQNRKVAALIEQRRTHQLEAVVAAPRKCPVCHEWYLPYASARHCSDACARTAQFLS